MLNGHTSTHSCSFDIGMAPARGGRGVEPHLNVEMANVHSVSPMWSIGKFEGIIRNLGVVFRLGKPAYLLPKHPLPPSRSTRFAQLE